MVDPALIRTNALPPPVRLEEVVVDGEVLSSEPSWPSLSSLPSLASWRAEEGTGTKTTKDISGMASPPVLRVPPGGGQIELLYPALSFCAPRRVRFRYRLERVEAGWVEAGVRRS